MMKKILILLIFISITYMSKSQDTTGFIVPGRTFTNNYDVSLVYMTESKLDRILQTFIENSFCKERVELMEKQYSIIQQKVFTCDSTISLKTMEARYWEEQLKERNKLLYDTQQELEKTKSKYNRRNLWFFLGGALASSIFISAIN